MTKAASSRLIYAIGQWITHIDDLPGWRDWQRKKIATILSAAEGVARPDDLPEYVFEEPLQGQHAAIMSFFGLHRSFEGLKQCEYYFRRYPFRGLPVTKEEHIRNICDMYFNRFYEFRERMKRCLNLVNKTLKDAKLEVRAVLRAFDKEFDQEIRARHQVHHQEAFEDLAFDSIGLATMMSQSESIPAGWEIVASRSYRSATTEWAQRVKRRSQRVEPYLEAVAEAMLAHCAYLQFPGEKTTTKPKSSSTALSRSSK